MINPSASNAARSSNTLAFLMLSADADSPAQHRQPECILVTSNARYGKDSEVY